MKLTGVLTDRIIFIVLFILTISLKTPAQTSHPKCEMRAIWVATVDNIDRPSSFTFVITTVSRLHYESQPSEDITLKY